MTPLEKFLKRLEVFGKTPGEMAAGKYGNARMRHEIISKMPQSALRDSMATESLSAKDAALRAMGDTNELPPEDFFQTMADHLMRNSDGYRTK